MACVEYKNRILIVDDEKLNLIYLNNLLGDDYTLYLAKNGAKALYSANEFLPDLILLDIVMPEMNGYSVLSELKKSERTRNIPVIFITGLGSEDEEAKGLVSGADDYIGKPFNGAIVRLRVQNQLKIVNQIRARTEMMKIISEKELEEESNRIKNDFLSRMNHELRTPINAIINMTALALDAEDPAKKNDYLIKSAAASRHLLRLVEDVLDITDISEGTFKLRGDEFDLGAMIQNIARNSENLFAKKRQALTAYVGLTTPGYVVGDERRVTQVIEHLLSNASKFTPEKGAVQLDVFEASIDGDDLTVQIDVTDNGAGIPIEKQGVIFHAFEQLDGGIDRKHGGVGAGLYMSKKIAEMMGGDIRVDSAPGKGSKFTFTFKTRINLNKREAELPASFAGKTALLADDIEINREVVMALLEKTRMQFICAGTGREAVELFSSDPKKINLILMDINMPEMDGVEATRRIRALGAPEGSRVPIIAVTANTNPDDVEKYIAAGMNAHVQKPADCNEIIRKISLLIA